MYYRLTYIASSNKEKIGDTIFNGNKPLNIGQGPSCNALLPESETYEPLIYASILSNNNNDGWCLVRRTDCHHVLVNGIEIAVAHRLSNNDLLSFTDGDIHAELKFEIFNDGEYDASSGFVYTKYKNNKRHFTTAILIALFVVGMAILLFPQKDLRHSNLKQFSQSVYHITVDSVYLLCDSVIDGEKKYIKIDSIELAEVAAGTAFLAKGKDNDDTLFITARHCIEPWINDEDWNGISNTMKMSPELRLATKAETGNRYAGYNKYILRSHCVISKGFERYDYYSTDFFMNKSRDMVIRLGTEEKAIYWRTIFPIAHRRDMELGDFAYIKATNLTKQRNGNLMLLAEWEDIKTFTCSKNSDIAVLGYPLNDNDADMVSVVYGNYMGLEFNDSQQVLDACLQLSAPINRGNSGGPILIKVGNDIKVIGIVSKADRRADQGMFWAVPITEVSNMHKQGDKIEENSIIYRR